MKRFIKEWLIACLVIYIFSIFVGVWASYKTLEQVSTDIHALQTEVYQHDRR